MDLLDIYHEELAERGVDIPREQLIAWDTPGGWRVYDETVHDEDACLDAFSAAILRWLSESHNIPQERIVVSEWK